MATWTKIRLVAKQICSERCKMSMCILIMLITIKACTENETHDVYVDAWYISSYISQVLDAGGCRCIMIYRSYGWLDDNYKRRKKGQFPIWDDDSHLWGNLGSFYFDTLICWHKGIQLFMVRYNYMCITYTDIISYNHMFILCLII